MIKTFKSKALKLFWIDGNKKSLIQEHVKKIERILTLLHASSSPSDMIVPGFDTHPLQGDRSGTWASTVHANWRITYRFQDADAHDVDYEDYH
jgi:proteic killer suppression protein